MAVEKKVRCDHVEAWLTSISEPGSKRPVVDSTGGLTEEEHPLLIVEVYTSIHGSLRVLHSLDHDLRVGIPPLGLSRAGSPFHWLPGSEYTKRGNPKSAQCILNAMRNSLVL